MGSPWPPTQSGTPPVDLPRRTGRAMPLSGRLTTPRRFLLAVGTVYVLAWCLPSVRWSAIGLLMRGWGATWTALTPFWKAGMKMGDLLGNLLSVSSALTNVVFIVALIHAWRWSSPDRLAAMAAGERRPFRWALWALGASLVLNLWWMDPGWFSDRTRDTAPGTDSVTVLLVVYRIPLAEGYYVWLLSFAALIVLLIYVRRGANVAAGVRLPA